MWKPEKYERSSSAQKLWAEELIRKIEIDGCERVLDIGCGDGRITADIADLLPNGSVLGIDSSKEMVRFAKERFPPEIHKNLRFGEADARDLSFDEEFDLVVLSIGLNPPAGADKLAQMYGIELTGPSFGASGEPSSPEAGSSSSSAVAATPPCP